MKKIVTLAFAAAALFAASANAQEVTYVEDCSQGVLINKPTDNWFLTVDGGANVMVGKHDIHTNKFLNRIGPNAGLYVGKWITPDFGFRFGGQWNMPKGATTEDGIFRKMNAPAWDNGYYPEKFMAFGPEVDMMINLTNWWCGYRPGRVYNSVVIFGGGFNWTMKRAYKGDDLKWRMAHDTQLFVSLAWQNNFRLCQNVDFFLEPRAEMLDFNRAVGLFSLNAGFTFKFNNTEWNCPLTAVCPTWKYTDAEGDALVARLDAANREINKLKKDLDDCLKRPTQTVVQQDCEGLVTVYYPINQSTLSNREKNVLKSVASVMKSSNKNYVLTGYADNFTGTDAINARLREARVKGVYNYLVNCGVNPDQLTYDTNSGSLFNSTDKATAPLDRAVTIREK